MGSSRTMWDQTRVPCIGRRLLNHWTHQGSPRMISDYWRQLLDLLSSFPGAWAHSAYLPTPSPPHPTPDACSRIQETRTPARTPNSKAGLLFAGRKPEAEGLKDICDDLVCLQNHPWEQSNICSSERCASQYAASVFLVRMRARWSMCPYMWVAWGREKSQTFSSQVLHCCPPTL